MQQCTDECLMKFNPENVMKTRKGVKRIDFDYSISGHKLQELICEGELGVDSTMNLSPHNHVGKIVKGKNYIQVNVTTSFKYIGRDVEDIYDLYAGICFSNLVSLFEETNITAREGPMEYTKDSARN